MASLPFNIKMDEMEVNFSASKESVVGEKCLHSTWLFLSPFSFPAWLEDLTCFLLSLSALQESSQRCSTGGVRGTARAMAGSILQPWDLCPVLLHLCRCSLHDKERRRMLANSDCVSLNAACAMVTARQPGLPVAVGAGLLLVMLPIGTGEAAVATGEVRAVLHKYLARCNLCLEGLII